MNDGSNQTDARLTEASSTRPRRLWPGALVVALVAAALAAPAVDTGTFINAPDSVLRLPLLAGTHNLPVIFSRDFMTFTDGQFRPLAYALVATARGWVSPDATRFWHAALAGLHVLNAVLVYLLAASFARRTWAAAFAGLVFAAHPMSALWVDRIDLVHHLVAASFFLGTLAAFVRFERSRRPGVYVLSLVLFVAGLLASKVLLVLPVLLLAVELLWERTDVRRALVRVYPFAAACVLMIPCWLVLRAHPMFYAELRFPPGTGWTSVCAFVARTPLHLEAVVGGVGFERPLGEIAPPVTSVDAPAALLWGALLVVAGVLAVLALRRRRWLGLGVLVAALASLPCVTVLFHHTADCVSWNTLYLVAAGFALFAGALLDVGLSVRARHVRLASACAAAVLLAWYGAALVRAHLHTRSAEGYWRCVLEQYPDSETASVGLGRVLLERGDETTAMTHLFSPAVRTPYRSSLAAAGHYIDTGDVLAAVVHYVSPASGMQDDLLANVRMLAVAARLHDAAGALDYVEHATAPLLMRNPWDTAAMRLVAKTLARKGRVRAARAWLQHARTIDPDDPLTLAQETALRRRMFSPGPVDDERIVPPDPDWLEYVMTGVIPAGLMPGIVEAADRHPADPVLRHQAGVCLVRMGQPEAGRRRIAEALKRIPHHPRIRADLAYALRRSAAAGTARDVAAAGGPPGMWHAEGCRLAEEGHLVEAAACLGKALEVDADFVDAHRDLAVVLVALGRPADAVAHLRRAAALDSADLTLRTALADALLAAGKTGDAEAVLRETLPVARSRGLDDLVDDIETRLRRCESRRH